MSLPFSRPLTNGQLIQLRLMTLGDLDCVVEIENEVNPSPWSRENFRNSIDGADCAIVATKSEDVASASAELLAFAVFSVAGGEAEVLNIAVAKNSQRQGIARLILESFIKALAGKADALFLEVRENNTAAINLYHDIGFNQVGMRPNYYPSVKSSSHREDALIFARTITKYDEG